VRKVSICSLQIWDVTPDRMCQLIGEWSDRREGHWIATLNLDYVARCHRDPDFHKLLSQADVFTADGAPVLWACRKIDPAFKSVDRTTGADLTPKLILMLEPRRVAIIGGQNPRAALRRLGRHPDDYFVFDAQVCLDSEWARDLASKIGDRSVVLVALGCPKQEQMISFLRAYLPGTVFIGVGGAFDMAAGLVVRAPLWMQRSGLEWLYRLAFEPRRLWRRYVVECPRGALALYRTVRQAQRSGIQSADRPT
jgi:N-acetylglucosaminyldiphosphoundecaprenol N-acetyl-beta-D-mannosaminyltransferase